MKLKDKIRKIQDELINEIKPLDSKHILTNADITPQIQYSKEKKNFFLRFQPVFISILILAIIIPLSISFLSRNRGFEDADNIGTPAAEEVDEIYGFLGTSAVALIYTTSDEFKDNQLTMSNNLLVSSYLNNINQLLPQIEMLLKSEKHNFYKVKSDKSNYKYKIIYVGTGLFNEELTYSIYFNENKYANFKYAIDCLVVSNNNNFKLTGNKIQVDDNFELEMRYNYNEENNKDYLMIGKLFSKDAYYFRVIKDDKIISNNILAFIENEPSYVKLENTTYDQVSTFKIYRSLENTFSVEYIITEDLLDSEDDNTPIQQKESGNIYIDVGSEENSYYVKSNSVTNTFVFENKYKHP